MIRLLELYPDHLNLNGDRANLTVLQRRLEWAGIDVELFTHRPAQPLPTTAPDFVMLGHGSVAAWRQIYADLTRIVPTLQTWVDGSTQMLAVSSGFAALHGLMSKLPEQVQRVPRESKFVIAGDSGESVVGYKNTDLDLPDFARFGNLIGTVLHGPVFAKNEALAQSVLTRMPISSSELALLENLKKPEITDYAKKASALASELASE
jgi:CobQ-like glutamine amidotransferase family enzyme